MKSKHIVAIAFGAVSATTALCQGPASAPAPRSGPGIQAPQDAREPDLLKTCKVPPTPVGGGRGPGATPGPGAAPQGVPRNYKVEEIPGVIAAGQQWKQVW